MSGKSFAITRCSGWLPPPGAQPAGPPRRRLLLAGFVGLARRAAFPPRPGHGLAGRKPRSLTDNVFELMMDQPKWNWLMLLESNTVGGPRTIVLSAATV